MFLKKLHFYFYTSNSPAITWTRTCDCRKQAVARGTKLLETCKMVTDLPPALLMPRHRKTRLVSLSEGKHMGSAQRRAAAPGSSCAAPHSSLLGGSGSSKPRSGLFSWLVRSALPLSSSLLLQQDPCSAELGPSFPEGSLSCHLPPAEHLAGCDLLHALPRPLPSSGRGDADPSAHWGLLHGDLLPPWGGAGPSPLLPAALCPLVQPRGAACCCLSAVLRHLAGAKSPFVTGYLGGMLVGAKLSEVDKKQLGDYFKQNICCICKSVKTNAKTNLQWVYSLVVCFQPFSSSSSGSEEGMLVAQAFVPSDTVFEQQSKTI